MLVTIHDVRGLISMQESDANVIGNKLKFLNIGEMKMMMPMVVMKMMMMAMVIGEVTTTTTTTPTWYFGLRKMYAW